MVGSAAEAAQRVGRLLGQLFEITALFDMRLRPELILLQKTMVSVEGVARRLQPDALAVVISGATGPQALQRLRAAGATVLTKPVAPADGEPTPTTLIPDMPLEE